MVGTYLEPTGDSSVAANKTGEGDGRQETGGLRDKVGEREMAVGGMRRSWR